MRALLVLALSALVWPCCTSPARCQPAGWTTIFSDDFSGAQDSFLQRWSVFAGNWYVSDGVLNQDHGGYDNGAVVRDLYLRCDYRLEARVRLVGGGAGTGLYWNVGDQQTGENGNMLRFDGNIPIMYGFMHGRGFLGSGGASAWLYADGTWHDIRLDVWNSRGTFDLYWDGKKVIDNGYMYHRAGYVGLQSSLGHSAFDDVRISVPAGTDWRKLPRGKVLPEWLEGIAVSANDTIVYAVGSLKAIQMVSAKGKLIKELEAPQLERPGGIACDGNGTFYVVDRADNTLEVFSSNGHLRTIALQHLSSAYGVASDASGQVWVSDPAGGSLWRVSRAGNAEQVLSREDGLGSPSHLSFARGKLFVADGNRIWTLDPAAPKSLEALDLGVSVRCVYPDHQGRLLVATGHGLRIFDPKGKPLRAYDGSSIGGIYASHVTTLSRGEIVVLDGWKNRILVLGTELSEVKPQVSNIGPDTATIAWRTDLPTPTRLVVLDRHVKPSLPPTANFSAGRRYGDGKERTQHKVVLKGLKPATRYTFGIPSPVTTIPPGEYSVPYRFTTHAPKGMMEYAVVPVAVLAYGHVTHESRRDASGNVPPPDIKDDAWFQSVRHVHEGMRMFYWTNSYFRLDALCKYLEVRRPVDFVHLGSSSEEIYKDVVELARREGIDPSDFGAVIVVGGNCCYAYPWPTPWWGGKLTYTTGCCFAGWNDMWISTHEFHHLTEGWMAASGIKGYQSADMPWGLPGRFGENYDFLAHTLRVMPRESWLNLAFGKIRVTADKDGDGVPDNDPRAPWDERRAGTSPQTPHSYRNGLTDLQNLTAGVLFPAVRGHKHPLLTKQINLKYPFAIFDYDYHRKKRTPKIDGNIAKGEWERFASTPNSVTPPPKNSIYYKALRIPPGADYRMQTYLVWDEDALYVAARAPFKFLLSSQVDCGADGYFQGKDNVILNVQIPRDEASAKPNEVHGVPGVMVWNNVEPVKERGVPDWTNSLFDQAGKVRWAWGRDREGWYCLELAIPRCEAVGLVPKVGKEMGIRLWVRALLPPTEANPDPGYAFEMFDSCEYGYFRLSK